MSILADVFILLSCHGSHGLQYLKLWDIKGKGWQDIWNSVALFVYIATHFLPWNRLIYRRKTKENKNFIIWILEILVDVQIGAGQEHLKKILLLLEFAWAYAFK